MKIFGNEVSWVILFGGKNRQGAIKTLLENNLNIKKVLVPNDRKELIIAVKEVVGARDVEIHEVAKDEIASVISGTGVKYLLSIGFPFKIHNEIIDRMELCLNLHPTLLPMYRGPNSGAYVIKNSESIAGSTVHILTSEIDSGPIIMQSKVKLTKFDTTKSMQRKVYQSEPELLLASLKLLENGFTPQEQDLSLGSEYPVRRPDDSEIDPTKSLIELFDDIRSSDPINYPAFFYINNQKVCISMWRPVKTEEDIDGI